MVEVLWNDLATRYSFALLCGYAMGSFYKETATRGYEHVCSQHTHVIGADGTITSTAVHSTAPALLRLSR